MAQLASKQRHAATANTVLVSSAFAAGTGGNAMTSTNYRMLGVLGEAGLPANQTTLSSQHFQHQPGFLAGVGVSSSPSSIYLPALMYNYINYFQGSNEVEPNNTIEQANGPLISGRAYSGLPDERDYFSFYTLQAGQIVVDVVNDQGLNPQLQLYYQSAGNVVGQDLDNQLPLRITVPNRAAGLYYLLVAAGDHASTTHYTLTVTYP